MRTSGPPTSSNGASSLHLFWVSKAVTEPVVAIGVDLEVLQTPSVDRLCFWALQATIRSGTAAMGGAHLGLQHHPDYPGGTAANWGGYHGRDSPETGELSGSPLAFRSALANPNTCNFDWVPGAAYRLEIQMRAPGRWAGMVTRIGEGDPIELRVLDCAGDRLTDFAVWTESFADCDAPGAAVRWANPTLTTSSGTLVEIEHAVVNYRPWPTAAARTVTRRPPAPTATLRASCNAPACPAPTCRVRGSASEGSPTPFSPSNPSSTRLGGSIAEM